MTNSELYQRHLDAVSRSFALCIPQLEQPFRDRVALAYLLFRVLDTVEDAPFADRLLQQRQFEAFRRMLRRPPARAEVDAFGKAFVASVNDGERSLLADTHILFDDAHALPEPARGVMLDALDRMAQGMAAYALRPSPLRLLDLEDVTRYCCFVAGLVGEMLTRLWALGGATPPPMLAAYRFGLFLQKVNILKDQREDELSGRFFVPDRRELLASLKADAQGAITYLTALPASERGYRTFCGWSLMLGAASLAVMDGPRQSHRAQTLALLERVAAIVSDDDALRSLFAELLPRLPDARPSAVVAKPESTERFVRMLAAPLSEPELAELRVLGEPLAAAAHQYG